MNFFRQYYKLWQVASVRTRSENDYRIFQAYQAQLIIQYLHKNHVDIANKLVLDLGGSALAGYSQQFMKLGATVMSLDLTPPLSTINTTWFVNANALEIPIQTNSVDFVFCASLIEHVASPQKLILEIERVLKIGGWAYLSFPPFYSPMGGHEFAPYHYLGEKIALKLKKREQIIPKWVKEMYDISGEADSYANLYPGWGLYKMTIYKARQLIKKSALVEVNRSTRYMPYSFVRWPLLGEFLTWHVQFLLKKKS